MKKVFLWLIIVSMIAVFSLAGCRESAEEAVVAAETAIVDLSTQALVDTATGLYTKANGLVGAYSEGTVRDDLTARLAVVQDAIEKAQVLLEEAAATDTPTLKTVVVPAGGHWVSAVPGKGMRIWDAISEGRTWWEYDIDLRVEGSTGSIAVTLITVSASMPVELRGGIGRKSVTPIENLKDNGTTIDFSFRDDQGRVTATFQLTRTPDGHLKGRYHNIGGIKTTGEGMELISVEFEGTLDLVPAPLE